jgi:hypothetical protein
LGFECGTAILEGHSAKGLDFCSRFCEQQNALARVSGYENKESYH